MSERSPWIDVSVPLHSGMAHWPGDPAPSFERISEIEQGEAANVTMCRMTAHTGTHMDSPRHFLAGKSGIDQFPFDAGIGRVRVITIPSGCRTIGRTELEGNGIERGERLILKTRNSGQRWDNIDFLPDFAALNASGAQFLAEAGVKLVGVDYLSVGAYQADGVETHQILLSAGIWIVEGLNLRAVTGSDYEMICLPLRIEGCDGAPARVILRPLDPVTKTA